MDTFEGGKLGLGILGTLWELGIIGKDWNWIFERLWDWIFREYSKKILELGNLGDCGYFERFWDWIF